MNSNKLIAEFMGWNKVDLGIDGYETPHSVTLLQADNMSFQTSWDWLMPVVEKIETLGYTFEKNYQPIDNDWQSLILKSDDIIHQSFNDDGLKSSYNVVVEFINEYNKCTTIHH